MAENRGHLWGSGEICAALGISRKTLREWRMGREFPEPFDTINQGRTDVWRPADVRAWLEHVETPDERVELRRDGVRAVRRLGSIRAAAEELGVTPARVRAWLLQAGEPLP